MFGMTVESASIEMSKVEAALKVLAFLRCDAAHPNWLDDNLGFSHGLHN